MLCMIGGAEQSEIVRKIIYICFGVTCSSTILLLFPQEDFASRFPGYLHLYVCTHYVINVHDLTEYRYLILERKTGKLFP